jgi:hypothetical protein
MKYTDINYNLIPEHIRDGMKRYIEEGIPPGGFLMAVLENNLTEAYKRADHINKERIPDIVDFVYNELPLQCWGSPNKVSEWIKAHNTL